MARVRFLIVVLLCCWGLQGQAQEQHSDGVDDIIQYVPYASVFMLKVCGVESRDDWTKLAVTTAASWVVSAGIGYTLKHTVKEWRPDHTDQKSFPSGHTMFAFAGATALHKEFGKVSPWISVAGYGVATFTAVDRVLNDRHHWYDAVAGAGIGIAATELTWWVSDRLFKHWRKKEQVAIGFSGNSLDLAIRL